MTAKPYTLEEVDMIVGHDEGTSRERIRATVERMEALEAAIRRAQQVGEIRFKTNALAAGVSEEFAALVGPSR